MCIHSSTESGDFDLDNFQLFPLDPQRSRASDHQYFPVRHRNRRGSSSCSTCKIAVRHLHHCQHRLSQAPLCRPVAMFSSSLKALVNQGYQH